MDFIANTCGIDTEESYPYSAGGGTPGTCQFKNDSIGATLSGCIELEKSEDYMATWLSKNGPISIGVWAGPGTGWQSYTGGIMDDCPAQQPDHGVLVVGYDKTATKCAVRCPSYAFVSMQG